MLWYSEDTDTTYATSSSVLTAEELRQLTQKMLIDSKAPKGSLGFQVAMSRDSKKCYFIGLAGRIGDCAQADWILALRQGESNLYSRSEHLLFDGVRWALQMQLDKR